MHPIRLGLVVSLLFSAPALAAPAIFPLKDVRPGLTGECLTVFQGTKPEPFKFKVVSVLRNFLPQQDVILVRLMDPRTDLSGVAAGMSGSPCSIDGKVMGAIAYAWSFSKEPLGGVTPIETMLAERARPERRKAENPGSTTALAGPGAAGSVGEPRLVQASIPLAVSGLSERALADIAPAFAPMGLLPVRAGGGGAPLRERPPGKVEPGSAIGVELIRGDISAVGTGTTTWVDGNTVLAFGHPMLSAGEVSLPMCQAEIHQIMSSLATSFKLASPLGEVGALVQDRQSCIIGDRSRRVSMVPFVVSVKAPDAEPRLMRTEIARDKRLMPILASMVIAGAVVTSEPDPVDVAVSVSMKVALRGMQPLTFADHLATTDGLSPRLLSASRGMRALLELLNNPFAPVVVDRVDVDVKVDFRRDFAEIVTATFPTDEVEPGDSVPLRVTMRPYAGAEYVETIPVTFPRSLAGRTVRVEVASGVLARPDVPKPETLAGLVTLLQTYWTAASLVVSLSTGDSGAALRGRLIPGMPPGAADTLRATTGTGRTEAFKVQSRLVTPFPRLVSGKRDLSVYVRPDVLGR